MTVLHVVDVAQKLELVIHGGDDFIQTVGNKSDLFVVFDITGQGIDGNFGELREVLLGAGSLLEEPVDRSNFNICIEKYKTVLVLQINLLDEDSGNDGITAGPDVFPAPLDIMDLVGGQFGLGISQILGFPNMNNNVS